MGASIWKLLVLLRTSWKDVTSTKFYYFCSRVSCWVSQRALDLQDVKLVLVTFIFNSDDKPKASIFTAFLDTSRSTCVYKSLCPPLLELLSSVLNPATLPNVDNFLCSGIITHRRFAGACVHTYSTVRTADFWYQWWQNCFDWPITRYEVNWNTLFHRGSTSVAHGLAPYCASFFFHTLPLP